MQGLVDALTGESPRAWVSVAGYRLHDLPTRARRLLVGTAGSDVSLEQGTVARAVRYRVPDSDDDPATLLETVGVDLGRLERAERTRLRRGGVPLTPQERARVHLARAVYGTPPLLVLDRVDQALGAGGRDVLRRLLAGYPGVAVVVPGDPERAEPLASELTGARTVTVAGSPSSADPAPTSPGPSAS